MNPTAANRPDLREEYGRLTLADSIRNAKIACVLVVVLMPIGWVMDHFVYPEQEMALLQLRLFTSVGAAVVLALLQLPNLSPWHYRILRMGWYVVPAFFICWMIRLTDGASSPYYAGLNLVILAVSSVIQATVMESVVAVGVIVSLYLATCLLGTTVTDWRMFTNNLTFILYTCSIVITGNYFYNLLRFREFTLRHELDASRQELEESNRKLHELDQAKSRFFANISHELRTPLTLLIAPLETLLNRYRSKLDPDSIGLLQTMQGNGMRLLKLINDLLDIVRLESGRLEVRREGVNLSEFIKGLASAARQMADDKRLRLETEIAPEATLVSIDRDKVEKTLLNLIFNALKFTPAGGLVHISAAREGEHLVLRVRDTGMGIAKEKLDQVFSRFWQADDSSRRKYQGVGIGLSLVKEFTELQGGTVTIESDLGKGATFTVRLPFLEATVAKTEEPARSAAPATDDATSGNSTVASQEWLSNLYRRAEMFPAMTAVRDAIKPVETGLKSHLPKVLIADDEPDMLRFLASQLREHYQIIEAVDGNQAVEKAAQFLPDLILTDMMMPEKDGLEVCRELRQRSTTQAIPVVLITARADEETKLAALAAGASDFLPKPFSTTELHVRVKNLIDSFDYQRKLSRQNRQLEQTIEQLQETEIQLVQTEKLASLGRLSAGIIHEINNPLNYATTGLFSLKKKAGLLTGRDREDFNEVLVDVEDGLQRVKSIVGDLRSFSHQDNQQLDDVNAADVVAATLRFLSHEARGKVHIETDIPRDLQVAANKNKLIQVLINLVQNAIDASLSRQDNPERPTIRISAEEAGGVVNLRVRDNGVGIPKENLGKIFDPFFTTKDVGKGMGLGLSICYRLLDHFGARISADSDPGRFTEFCITFPRATATTTTSEEVPHVAGV